MNRSISRAAAAAARDSSSTGGGPSRLGLSSASASSLAPSRSAPSRPLSQLTMGFDKIEEWKQNKIKQAGLEASGNKTPKPTIFDLKIDTPIHKSSIWNISFSADKAYTQPINTRNLQQQMSNHPHPLNDALPSPQALRNLRTEPGKTMDPEGATTPKESKKTAKFVIIDTKLIFKARLSESPEICDPSDPENDMGVDHQAFYQRQVPLFLGGGPFC